MSLRNTLIVTEYTHFPGSPRLSCNKHIVQSVPTGNTLPAPLNVSFPGL